MLLSGEFYEIKCHQGPITRLRVSYDDCLLISAGEDGTVVVMDIRDKELAKVSMRQQQVISRALVQIYHIAGVTHVHGEGTPTCSLPDTLLPPIVLLCTTLVQVRRHHVCLIPVGRTSRQLNCIVYC